MMTQKRAQFDAATVESQFQFPVLSVYVSTPEALRENQFPRASTVRNDEPAAMYSCSFCMSMKGLPRFFAS
ncbi:MAG: hypothetical protein IPQ09_26175 [Myxococcales bacterium]|nr:hypothetical protein [Myxococcales bacterium]